MKKIYVSPEIEYDDFSLDQVVCANLYGNNSGRSAEFYAIGGGVNGTSVVEGTTVPGGDDRPSRG
ncbi:MAG: hypothetical protein ACI4RI_03425 [Ruminococcus sp.]